MKDFQRYAIYYLCQPGPLADFGAAWLGWDCVTGRPCAHPRIDGLPRPVADITATPRKYGFHGTIKPPFRLADGASAMDLAAAARAFCAGRTPVTLNGLALTRLGGFLALTPVGNAQDLSDLAGACVAGLDTFRAAPPQAELDRRRARGLSQRQENYLKSFGYPYVMEEFRFHMTLTGQLDDTAGQAVHAALSPWVDPLLPRPFVIDALALVGADDRDHFHLIERLPLVRT